MRRLANESSVQCLEIVLVRIFERKGHFNITAESFAIRYLQPRHAHAAALENQLGLLSIQDTYNTKGEKYCALLGLLDYEYRN
jgi:predicted LPLAT superfamily acyltransferase